MAGGKSDHFEKLVLDHFLGAVAAPPLATIYVALSTAAWNEAATGASMSEVAAGGYGRVAVENTEVNWPAASGASPATKSNGAAIGFPAATANWGTVVSFYLLDAASGGNVLYGGDLGTQREVLSGDTATFAPGTLVVTED